MTDLSTIKSWPREQLESAFTQREWQLAEALRTIEAQWREIKAIKSERDELRIAMDYAPSSKTDNATR